MIEREKLQHLIENIGIPKLCLILLLGVSLIIVSIPSGKTKKNAQSTETTAKEDSTDLYVKKQERRLVNALKHVEGVGKVKVMITVNSSKEAVVNKDSPYEQSSSEIITHFPDTSDAVRLNQSRLRFRPCPHLHSCKHPLSESFHPADTFAAEQHPQL